MLIIPAIDIIGGKVVRLEKGDFKKATIYSSNPLEICLKWQNQGANFLHIVDLDAAKQGRLVNSGLIIDIIKKISIPAEIGGGLRSEEDVELYIKNGAGSVVLGTRVFEDRGYLKKLLRNFKEKIIVSVDFRGNKVVEKGWQHKTDLEPIKLIKDMQDMGVKRVIVTDTSRDGTLKGPNIKMFEEILSAVNISIVASGGVSSLNDIRALKEIGDKNLLGVIIGKALYENKLDMKEAMKLANA